MQSTFPSFLLYHRRTILDLADKPDLAGATALRDRNRVLLLGYIKDSEAFVAVREDLLAPSEQPSSFNRAKGWATVLRLGHDV